MSREPPAKRVRTESRGDDDYSPGSIVEIEVYNFMTYTHLKSKPGPRLNLIVGPNGTGKSTLVCAIGIGLSGDPQLLGRAGRIGDFVRRGEESGWTKISLRGDSPDELVVIKRMINKRNVSEWLVNDRPSTKKAVQDKVQKYNIQLDNLTQFLPQDRVSEFAKLTPIQLLEETEKAVGNPELSAHHQTLIHTNQELKVIKTALSSHESSLAHIVASNEDLEEDKQRMEERARFLEKAALLKRKLPLLRYEEAKVQHEEAKDVEGIAKGKVNDLQNHVQEINASFMSLTARRDKAKEASERLRLMKTRNEQGLQQIADSETEMAAKVRAKFSEIQDIHKKEAARQDKLQKARKAVTEASETLENLPAWQPQPEVMNEFRSQIEGLRLENADKQSQMKERETLLSQKRRERDTCMRRLQDINSANTRLLHALKNSGTHQIFEAYDWVQSHRSEFKNQVFGPVLLEVRVKNKEYAKYVENHVPQYLWKAFITQNAEDRDLLVRNLRHFGVPVINQSNHQSRYTPISVTSEMAQHGIITTLDEIIEAHEVIKKLLIGQSMLDKSFIGTSKANQMADEVARLGIRDLWTPENHHRWSGSRYGSHISKVSSSVRPAKLFSENVDLREKNEIETRKAKLEDDMRQLEISLQEFSRQCKSCQEETERIEKQRDEIFHEGRLFKKRETDAKANLEHRKKRLVMLENEESSADAENRSRSLIKEINIERVQNLTTLKDRLAEIGDTQMRHAGRHLQAIELEARVREMEKDVMKRQFEVQEAERNWRMARSILEIKKAKMLETKAVIDKDARANPDVDRSFAELPDTVTDIEDAILDCETQAAAVICNNPNAILIYEQRREQIRALTSKVEEKRSALDACMKQIETTREKWLPTLRNLVSSINETFGRNFMEMAVAGEVSLDEQGFDFDRYGILIKVKFRETASLQVLSAHHQSGGERSVSTILYLLSLQDLTYCPFRVVDEINQGMDPTNERKMFEQLVRAASQRNTPQCLLLTPKLLPDLHYSAACTILNIMNGPFLEEASINWKDGLTWSAMSQMVASQ